MRKTAKTTGLLALVLGQLFLYAACGSSQSKAGAESNGVPTEMGTDADSTNTPYMDTTAARDSGQQ